MKKLIAVAAVAVVAVATMAVGSGKPQRVSEAEVQAAIDSRLHQLLVKMNAQHAPSSVTAQR